MAESASQKAPKDQLDTGASPRALIHLFGEFERARSGKEAAEDRMSNFAHAIRLLIDSLPSAQKLAFERRFEEIRTGATPQSRGGEMYGNVIALFKRDRRGEWAVPEIFDALGQPANTKALYNAIHYLAKTGRIERIARGKYVVRSWGVGFDAAEEIEGADGPPHRSEHDW